jgi:hypothetical protein
VTVASNVVETGAAAPGIVVRRVVNCLVTGNRVTANGAAGAHGIDLTLSQGCTVSDNVVLGPDVGVVADEANHLQLIGNYVYGPRTGFRAIERPGGKASASNVVFVNNRVLTGGVGFVVKGSGMVLVANYAAFLRPGPALWVQRGGTHDAVVANNASVSVEGGIRFDASDGVVAANVPISNSSNGIEVNGERVAVTGNAVNASPVGIRLGAAAAACTIVGNTLHGTSDAPLVLGGRDHRVRDNVGSTVEMGAGAAYGGGELEVTAARTPGVGALRRRPLRRQRRVGRRSRRARVDRRQDGRRLRHHVARNAAAAGAREVDRRRHAAPRMTAAARRVLEQAAIVAAFALATAWVLWPLPRHPATRLLDASAFYGKRDWLFAPDVSLVQWILGWDTHALTTAPWRLFDANIFHPAPRTLALSEHLLGYWPLFAPVYLATGNPALAYNATLLASFALSGMAMCILVRHWTGNLAAGLLAGIVYAFAPWRLEQLGHLQLLGLYAAPLVLLAWDHVLASGRRGALVLLAGAFLVQCLCSYYLAYATFALTAAYALATLPGARVARIAGGALALAVAAGLFALVSLPYFWVRETGVLADVSPAAQAALGAPSWRHFVWPLGGNMGMRPYQGRVALLLAAFALVPIATWRRTARPQVAVVVGLALTAVLGYLLALGSGR